MNTPTPSHRIQSNYRLMLLMLSRFCESSEFLTTLPIVRPNVDKVNIIIGYAPVSIIVGSAPSINLVNVIADYLSGLYLMPVNLRFIAMGNLFIDANVLAHYISLLIGGVGAQSYTFNMAMRSLVKYLSFGLSPRRTAIIPITMSGVKIRVSGRLATEPTRPRQTVHEFTMGNFKSNTIQAGSFTTTNTKGSITVKVWLSLL